MNILEEFEQLPNYILKEDIEICNCGYEHKRKFCYKLHVDVDVYVTEDGEQFTYKYVRDTRHYRIYYECEKPTPEIENDYKRMYIGYPERYHDTFESAIEEIKEVLKDYRESEK